ADPVDGLPAAGRYQLGIRASRTKIAFCAASRRSCAERASRWLAYSSRCVLSRSASATIASPSVRKDVASNGAVTCQFKYRHTPSILWEVVLKGTKGQPTIEPMITL